MGDYFRKLAEPNEEERKVVYNYTITDYIPINEYLDRNIIPSDISEEEILHKIKCIDDYLSKFQLKDKILVYRTEAETKYGIEKIEDLLDIYSQGSEIRYKYFVSTSFSEEVADNFVLKYKSEKAKFILKISILVTPNTKCAYIKGNSYFEEEEEVLIARNVSLIVLKSVIEDKNIIRIYSKLIEE